MKDKASDARPPQIHIEKAVIDDYGLNVNAGWLYVVIVSHVNGQSGVAFPSYTRLTKLTGMSRPTINKYIKVLEDKGLIEVIREKVDGTNERGVNHYRVLPATRGGKTVLPPSKAEVVKEVNHVVNEINHPGKAGLPQVVKEVAYNYIESNQIELTKSAAPACDPQTQEVLDFANAKDPNGIYLEGEITKAIKGYGIEWVMDALQKAFDKPADKPLAYALATLKAWKRDGRKTSPPIPLPPPNGKPSDWPLGWTWGDPNRQKENERMKLKKASGE